MGEFPFSFGRTAGDGDLSQRLAETVPVHFPNAPVYWQRPQMLFPALLREGSISYLCRLTHIEHYGIRL
jgi:hypothetical protein